MDTYTDTHDPRSTELNAADHHHLLSAAEDLEVTSYDQWAALATLCAQAANRVAPEGHLVRVVKT